MRISSISSLVMIFALLLSTNEVRAQQSNRYPKPVPIPEAPREIGVEPNTWEHSDDLDLHVSPDGSVGALSDGLNITLWSMSSGRRLRKLRNDRYVLDHTFSADGKFVFAAYKDGSLVRWNSSSGAGTRLNASMPKGPSTQQIPQLLLTVGRDRLVVIGDAGAITVLRFNERGEVASASAFPASLLREQLQSAWITPDGHRAVLASEAQIVTVDLATGARLSSVTVPAQIKMTRVLNERDVLAIETPPNCEVDSIVIFQPFAPASKSIVLDPAPRCKAASEPANTDFTFVLSRDGRRIYTKRDGAAVYKVWQTSDWRTPLRVTSIAGNASLIGADDRVVISSTPNRISVRDGETGREVGSLGQPSSTDFSNAVVSDRGRVHSLMSRDVPGEKGHTERLLIWQVDTAQASSAKLESADITHIHDVSLSADRAIGATRKGEVVVVSPRSGRELLRRTVAGVQSVDALRLSPDGRTGFIHGSSKRDDSGRGIAVLFDIASGATRATLSGQIAAFSHDGNLLAVARNNMQVDLYRVTDGRKLKRLDTDVKHRQESPRVLVFSADGKFVIGGTRDGGLYVWSLETGKLLHVFERKGDLAGHVNIASVAISADGKKVAGGLAVRSPSSGDLGRESGILVWDAQSERQLYRLRGHEGGVTALSFSPDGRWLVSSGYDGTIRYWNAATGRLTATASMDASGRWSIVTAEGFVAGSPEVAKFMSIVDGQTATRLDQVWQSLYQPDLVRDTIAGDPEGEVAGALRVNELSRLLKSGAPPLVSILSIEPGTVARDEATVRFKVTEQGHGIGRVELRINGITSSIVTRRVQPGNGIHEFAERVFLDGGENIIDVVAYNSKDLIASIPATMTYSAPALRESKSTLHILAIGVDNYIDKGWTPPGATKRQAWAPLVQAKKDAEFVAERLAQAARGLHANVSVTTVLNENASRRGLEAAVERIAPRVGPHDTFILFIAGHGTTENGRFFFIPQDYQSGPGALQTAAIGQETIQDWLSNKIRARRAVLLLDTCESGALVAGHLRSRLDAPATDAGIGRLHEATGRPVLTAAALGTDAFEGYRGHGFFTWALLDALENADVDRSGTITLSELASHVQSTVTRISLRTTGGGQSANRAITRDSRDQQSARFGSRGEDFPIARVTTAPTNR